MPTRRAFLASTAAGTAALSLPGFLAGCATARGPATTGAVPTNPFYAWFGIDDATLRRVMDEVTAHGADHADLYFQYRRANALRLEDGVVSSATSDVSEGVGLRVVRGDQTGYAYTEELTVPAMLGAARTARAIAAAGGTPVPPVPFGLLPSPAHYSVAVPWSEVGVDRKLPLLLSLEARVKALDPAIASVRLFLTDEEERVLVADHRGHVHTDVRPMTRLWVSVTAEKAGVTQSGASNLAARAGMEFYDEGRLALVARQAVDRTMILFDAVRPPAGELPVVLAAGASGILLHEAVGHGMEADFNRKGTSIYSDMIGKQVAPEFVTIVDSGVLPNERGALNFDDEGSAVERTVLVENGVMRSYLHDSISARHYGVASTGSGRRESFRHVPMPRMRCTYMEDGPHTREEIVAAVPRGIVAETFTNGQVQIGAGDFTFYIKNGWLIEDGRITAPIKDCNIIGNGPEALRAVTMAAADGALDTGGWTCGKDGQSVPVSQGLPTVLVKSLVVGGVS